MRRSLAVIVALAFAGTLAAQGPADRFELGQRLRGFEAALDKQTDSEKRTEAIKPLGPLTAAFLSGRVGETARLLDTAHLHLLTGKEPDAAQLSAIALRVEPSTHLIDTTASDIDVRVSRFYKTEFADAGKLRLRLTLCDSQGKPLGKSRTLDMGTLPLEAKFQLSDLVEGDHVLKHEVLLDDKVLFTRAQGLSVIKDLKDRREKLLIAAKGFNDKPKTTERESLAKLIRVLADLADGKTLETTYPAAQLMKEVEDGVAAFQAGKPVFGDKKPGQFRMQLVTKNGTRAVRLQAPEAAKKGDPLPLVIALHGAGGSENLFFDGYGAGLVTKLGAERGWLVVSPAVDFFGDPTDGLVEEIAKFYPVDREKVFVIGHSMGAAKAVAAASKSPTQFRAVVALGGTGSVTPSDDLKKVAFFVGVGTGDFARGGARSLSEALKKAEVTRLQFKEYEGVEHLTVVQLSLPEVFKFLDETVKK